MTAPWPADQAPVSPSLRLKRAFNQAFWLPGQGWYAAALDRDKRPVDTLTSNIGHCLWTGIADQDKAAQVADRLLSADMFSGWGIRTLAASMTACNPMSYHNGSVWPHDNALCAAGLAPDRPRRHWDRAHPSAAAPESTHSGLTTVEVARGAAPWRTCGPRPRRSHRGRLI